MSKKFLKGVELPQEDGTIKYGYFIPNLTNVGAPTESTQGAVGSLYMDTNTGNIYKCTKIENGRYIWESIKPLIITINEDSNQASNASNTSTEIFEASLERPVLLDYHQERYHLNYCNKDRASFVKLGDDRHLEELVVDEAGDVEYFDHGFIANTEQLENKAVIDDTTVGADAWSSKHTVDKLCPVLDKTASVVICEPVESYPLKVVSVIPKTEEEVINLQLYRGGKNLFDFKATPYKVTFGSETTSERIGFKFQLPAGTYTLHAEGTPQTDGDYLYGVVYSTSGELVTRCNLVAHTTLQTHTITLSKGDVVYIYNGWNTSDASIAENLFNRFNVQIEAGRVATDYEPYRGEVFIADVSQFPNINEGGLYHWSTGIFIGNTGNVWQHKLETGAFDMVELAEYTPQTLRVIPALAGTNYIYDAAGTVEVKCALDPKPIITDLSDQITALQAEQNKTYELIEDFTLEEDVIEVLRNEDGDGNAYNFSAIRIAAEVEASSGQAQLICTVYTTSPTSGAFYMPINGGINTTKRVNTFVIRNDKGFTDCFATSDTSYNQQARASVLARQWENVTKIRVFSGTNSVALPAGTRIRIYGIRG